MKCIVWIFALCIAARAQVSGTIIVFDITSDGFFIAADSRSTFKNAPPEDCHCKIAALNHNTVFAVSGGAAYPAETNDPVESWDAIHEARLAALGAKSETSISSRETMLKIADAWAKSMELHWNRMKTFHPEKVQGFDKRWDGILTTGIFASAENNSLSVMARVIKSEAGNIASEPLLLTCTLCGTGEGDVFNEFIARKTTRSKGSDGDLPVAPIYKVIRLVDLTIAYDKSGTVGGPIDALQLAPDGHITWFQQKKDCPENHR